jgi:hypothetical protein
LDLAAFFDGKCGGVVAVLSPQIVDVVFDLLSSDGVSPVLSGEFDRVQERWRAGEEDLDEVAGERQLTCDRVITPMTNQISPTNKMVLP